MKYIAFSHLRIAGPLVIDVNDTKQSYSFILYDKTLGMPFLLWERNVFLW